MDTIKSDQRGLASSKPLPLGRYTIRETKAPAGDDSVQPHLGGEGVAPVEGLEHDIGIVGDAGQHIVDWLAPQIQIVKKSADYNSTNGLPAGTLLEGALLLATSKRRIWPSCSR